MIYFCGEKPPRKCQKGDITLYDNKHYVKIDHVVNDGSGVSYHALTVEEYTEVIQGLFAQIEKLWSAINSYRDLSTGAMIDFPNIVKDLRGRVDRLECKFNRM